MKVCDNKKICQFFTSTNIQLTLCIYIFFCSFMLFSLYNDLSFFDFSYRESGTYGNVSGNPHSVSFYLSIKFLFILISYISIKYSFEFIYLIIVGNEEKRQLLSIILGISFVYFIFIILTWPGIWRCDWCDEIKLFSFTQKLQVQYNQGFLMSLFYIFSMMIYPHPTMVIILQALIGSIVFGYIIYELIYRKNSSFGAIIISLVILSPGVIFFVLYPMRAYLTGVFFSLFLYCYFYMYDNGSINKHKLIWMIISAVITINFRIEMMVLIPIVPIILYITLYNQYQLSKRAMIYSIYSMIILIFSVYLVTNWNHLGNQSTTIAHNMLSFTGPLGDILAKNGNNIPKYEVECLNKCFYIDKMVKDHSDNNNFRIYSYERYTKPKKIGISIEEYRKCQQVTFKILLKHPHRYLQNKLKLAYFTVFKSHRIIGYNFAEKIPKNVSKHFNQLNPKLSNSIKKILSGSFNIGSVRGYQLVFPIYFPFILLLLQIFILVINKQYCVLIPHLVVYTIFFIVILTAVTSFPMYYFPCYLAAWTVFSITRIEQTK